MPKKCGKCNTECNSDAADSVCCVECNEVIHVVCAGLNAARKNTRNRPYKCEKCQDTGSLSSMSDNEESAILKAINNLRTDFKNTLEQKLSHLEEKINESVRGKIDAIEERIIRWEDSLNSEVKGLKSENITLRKDHDALKQRCDDLERRVGMLTDQIQDLNQYSRVDNLEIVGVPLTKNEDVYAILKTVANTIKTPWRREDVSVAHRLPRGRQEHPNIIVRFTSRTVKTAWMQAARKLNVTANMVHSSFPNSPVFINEHLAAHVKATLSRAKNLVKEKRLAFAWVREGKILVKRTADGRTTRVRSFADVEAAAAGTPQRQRSSGGSVSGGNTGGGSS